MNIDPEFCIAQTQTGPPTLRNPRFSIQSDLRREPDQNYEFDSCARLGQFDLQEGFDR